jgi:hypothetical protein
MELDYGEALMIEKDRRIFVGIKISTALQNELEHSAPGTKQYFDGNDGKDYLEIVDLGEARFIGRYVKNGIPAADIGDVSRNVRSIVQLITRGRRIEERDVHIYSS